MVIEDAPPIVQIPIPEAKPRRGRPPKLDEDGNRVNAPRGTRKPKRKPPTRRATPRGPRSLRRELAAMLTLVNSLILMTPLGTRPIAAITDPSIEPERIGDELDAAEIDALAQALDVQAQRSPRFRKVIEGFLSAGAGGQLVGIVGIIATRRAARHGVAPAILDPMLGQMLAGGDLAAAMEFAPTPTPTREDNPETGETAPQAIDYETIDES